MKTVKTNAMRILDKAKLPYEVHTYEHKEKEAVDGLHVAEMLQEDPRRVFKTLLTRSNTKQIYVFVLPVEKELDFKKCAKIVQEKSIEMIQVKEINQISGYIRGGCSPIGMKKLYPTVFHESCLLEETIYFSGGKIGCQIQMKPSDVMNLIHAKSGDIVKDE